MEKIHHSLLSTSALEGRFHCPKKPGPTIYLPQMEKALQSGAKSQTCVRLIDGWITHKAQIKVHGSKDETRSDSEVNIELIQCNKHKWEKMSRFLRLSRPPLLQMYRLSKALPSFLPQQSIKDASLILRKASLSHFRAFHPSATLHVHWIMKDGSVWWRGSRVWMEDGLHQRASSDEWLMERWK